ncbi:uncharacterized protein LOC131251437 isoform X2 [Magnolia sinica]|uniref:uncharacterized protein LOC131251437 isoform X2 n=1 Tax=Magnolia sinica TaxID=86752 RepID=UPI002659134A|nr:uncharacterized protein LOC131251437 isoform X2 [Magnolia sinica]
MLTPKKSIPQLLFYLILTFFFSLTSTQSTSETPTPAFFCGKIKIQNLTTPSPLNSILLCKSQNLYFRTSLGLFPVSSIDYGAQTLTISHPSCSPSLHFISPSLLSSGFPPPPKPNSLLLFNCYNSREKPMSSFLQNCSHSYNCSAQERDLERPFSCLLVDDSDNLELGFHPKNLNCSHYRRVYRSSSSSAIEGFEGGTRVSFGIPDHIPRVCDECSKPDGNCGIGLRCMCHPKECRCINGANQYK